jgi:hypothetical protein
VNVLFHPAAESEFNAAIDYYEDIEKGLGYDFSLEVFSALERIIAFPKAWLVIEDGIRRSFPLWDFICGRKRQNLCCSGYASS